MKTHRSFLLGSLGLLIFTSLTVGCTAAEKLPCPEPGYAIPMPGPGEEYISFIAQKYEYGE